MDGITNYYLEEQLANGLRKIYYESRVKKQFSDNSELLSNITELVEANIKLQKEIFNADPTVSYRISISKELTEAFLKTYQAVLEKAEDFAYSINSRFEHGIDLASVLCPFILYKLGVTDETASFYVGIGLILAKIVCDSLANNKQKKIELSQKMQLNELKETCSTLKTFMENSSECIPRKEFEEINNSLSTVIESLELLNDDITNINTSLERTNESLDKIIDDKGD